MIATGSFLACPEKLRLAKLPNGPVKRDHFAPVFPTFFFNLSPA
jgi:hypothetical protein